MSAYLCDSETFSLLAAYWCRGATTGEQLELLETATRRARSLALAGERVPNGRQMAEACGSVRGAVFGALVLENVRSMDSRYPHHKDETYAAADALQLVMVPPSELLPSVAGRVAAAVAELDYQSCEHEGWERSLAFCLLDQIRIKLLRDLQAIATPERVSHG